MSTRDGRIDFGTALEVGQVLAWRLPMIAVAMVDPNPRRRAEMVRMVTEKQLAVAEGMIAGQMALWQGLLTGRVDRDLGEEVLAAIHRPALKTLHANARRVSKRRRY